MHHAGIALPRHAFGQNRRHVVIGIAGKGEEHLEILSELAEVLSDATLRQTLFDATDPEAIHKVLSGWEPYRPAVA